MVGFLLAGDGPQHLTPLMHAAKHGRVQSVALMLYRYGADPNKQVRDAHCRRAMPCSCES